MPDPPFVDPHTNELDTSQIAAEALPILALVLAVGALALLPFLFAVGLGGDSFLGVLFTLLSQLVLAVGGGVVLLYVVARGVQLSGVTTVERRQPARTDRE
jgi:hypothetical protein